MRLIGIIAVLATTGWIGWSIQRRFRQRTYPSVWKVAAAVLGGAGLAVGIWLVTREYLISPTVRLVGSPFAIGGYQLIGGRWLGSLVSHFVLLSFFADIATGIGICLLPLHIAQVIFARKVAKERMPNVS